ncbi:PspC domain-containing protein [Flaviflexus sp.]|uniref:PspC domain-containing protein n=1 Tax=Flaviflexus sp. TaxID=1969482 RepID=UPI003F915858
MAGDSFFDSIRAFGVTRASDTPLAGVSAGLAKRWNVDPLVVRAIFVALTVMGGAGITLYALGWLFLPDETDRIHGQEPFYGQVTASFVFGVLIVFASLGGTGWGWGWGNGWPGPFALLITIVVVAVVIVTLNAQRDKQPPHGTGPATGRGTATGYGSPSGHGSSSFGTATGPATSGPATSGSASYGSSTGDGATASSTTGGDATDYSYDSFSSSTTGGDATSEYTMEPPTDRYATSGAAGSTPPGPSGMSGVAGAPGTPPDRSELYSTTPVKTATPDNRPVAGTRTVLLALAFILIVIAAFTYMSYQDIEFFNNSTIMLRGFAIVSLVLGLIVIGYGMSGRRGGGLSALAIIAAILTFPAGALMAFPQAEHHVLMGHGSWSPTTVSQVEGGFSVLMGEIEIDVTDLEDSEFDVRGTMGDINLVVDNDQKIAVVTDFTMADLENATGNYQTDAGFTGDTVYYVGGIDDIEDADIIIHVDMIMSSLTIER